jgi:hypothetical protein
MPRPISVVEELPEAAKLQVLAWLERYPPATVVEMMARPEPDGFGVQTHVTTLRRFNARRLAAGRPDEIDVARLFLSENPEDPIENATHIVLKDWAFQIATHPQRTSGGFKALSRWLLKLREHKQRELQLAINKERLALERQKFEFNAARQALLHHDRLGGILKDQSSDDEAKINAAREQLFGRPVPPMKIVKHETPPDGSAVGL